MDFFGSYRSPFGYENGENGGLDATAFSPTVQAALNLANNNFVSTGENTLR